MRRYAFESFITHVFWLTAVFLLTEGLSQPLITWLAQFNRWDARWYFTIAFDGHGFLPQTYAFPPLYDWILSRLTDLGFNTFDVLKFPITGHKSRGLLRVHRLFECLIFSNFYIGAATCQMDQRRARTLAAAAIHSFSALKHFCSTTD